MRPTNNTPIKPGAKLIESAELVKRCALSKQAHAQAAAEHLGIGSCRNRPPGGAAVAAAVVAERTATVQGAGDVRQ